jgi:hypothetical protein
MWVGGGAGRGEGGGREELECLVRKWTGGIPVAYVLVAAGALLA